MFFENGALPPEISALLQTAAEMCPASALHAGHILGTLSRTWTNATNSGGITAASLLTPGGYPLEFTFRSGSSNLSYTADPGLPQAIVAEKWRLIHALDGKLGIQIHPLLPMLAAQPAQQFGCWLGVRHQRGAHRFKVYQEVGPQASPRILQHLRGAVPGLADAEEISPSLLGVMPGTGGATEYYCKVERPGPAALHRLYAAIGRGRLLPCVIDSLAYLAAQPQEKLLDRLRIGISYSVAPERPPRVTLYAHACQLFNGNRQTRLRWLGLVRQLGGEAALYEQLTRAFEEDEPPDILHGLVGIGITETGRIECSLGLRPFIPNAGKTASHAFPALHCAPFRLRKPEGGPR